MAINRYLRVSDSDTVELVGYDYDEAVMEIVFKTAPSVVYRIRQVQAREFVEFINAESIGTAFHKSFKNAKAHPFTKHEVNDLIKSTRKELK